MTIKDDIDRETAVEMGYDAKTDDLVNDIGQEIGRHIMVGLIGRNPTEERIRSVVEWLESNDFFPYEFSL